MAFKFDLNRLQNIYAATMQSVDKATAFEIEIDKGRFLFMMFLSKEDYELKDMLVVYMRNTSVLHRIKLSGNHEENLSGFNFRRIKSMFYAGIASKTG